MDDERRGVSVTSCCRAKPDFAGGRMRMRDIEELSWRSGGHMPGIRKATPARYALAIEDRHEAPGKESGVSRGTGCCRIPGRPVRAAGSLGCASAATLVAGRLPGCRPVPDRKRHPDPDCSLDNGGCRRHCRRVVPYRDVAASIHAQSCGQPGSRCHIDVTGM